MKHGKTNATLPKDVTLEDVTLEQALMLIAEKVAKSVGTKTKTRAKVKTKSKAKSEKKQKGAASEGNSTSKDA